jgi:multimeric flavodoxin WrbA
MKIIGVSASPRKKQSTYFALEQCLDEVKLASEASGKGIDVEIIDLAGLKINGCISCDACKKDLICSQKDDFQQLISKFADPEVLGIILASSVYKRS